MPMNKIRYILIPLFLLTGCSPLRKYEDLPEVKAWESDIKKFEALDKKENYQADAVIFAGSSSIRMWSTLSKDMEPYHVIQRGYGGAKLSDFAVYAGRIFSNHPCRALVLFIANDITGVPEDKSPEEVKKLFLNILETFRKTHHSQPVFWIAITPTSSRWKVWPKISRTNELIRKECENHRNTYFIRTDYAFLNDEGKPNDDLFAADRLHLNPNGYVIWSGIIKNELDRVLKKQ